jgi:hypothetical protein
VDIGKEGEPFVAEPLEDPFAPEPPAEPLPEPAPDEEEVPA